MLKIDINKVLVTLAEKHMNYKEFCKVAKISEVEFRKIRSGGRNPKPATIGKIASALGVSVQDIVQEGDED